MLQTLKLRKNKKNQRLVGFLDFSFFAELPNCQFFSFHISTITIAFKTVLTVASTLKLYSLKLIFMFLKLGRFINLNYEILDNFKLALTLFFQMNQWNSKTRKEPQKYASSHFWLNC
jgi:hypothetical protein